MEEKTDGIYPKDQVISISLNSLRNIDLNTITEQLINVTNFNKIIVNAFEYCDLKVFCIALYRAMKRGKLFMFRTAASFVKVMGGVSDIPLLTKISCCIKNQIQEGSLWSEAIPKKLLHN